MTVPKSETPQGLWALILAGGEGTRLKELTTSDSGTAIPKQFCSLAGGRTLLEDAIARARGLVPSDRICPIVAQQHRQWWSALLHDGPAQNLIVQPRNRGTAIGILYSVLHIVARDPDAHIILLPADHYVRDEPLLRQALRIALARVEQGADAPILLGTEPDHSDTELGYLLPGGRDESGTQMVARFIERPEFTRARDIVDEGGLWNTFIVVSTASALIELFMPRYDAITLEMQAIVARARGMESTDASWPSLVEMYERLPSLDFSHDVLTGQEKRLRLLRVPSCGWSDLGTPKHVAQTLQRLPPEQSSLDTHSAQFLNLAARHLEFARQGPPG